MKKIIILATMMLLMLLVACETTKIVAPQGQTVILAGKDADCKLVKERKIVFLYGVPIGQDVFKKLFEGVRNPVKVRIMSTFIDNMMSSSANDRSGRKVDVKVKTMKVYECTGGTSVTNTNTQDFLKKDEVKEEVKEEVNTDDSKKTTSEVVDEKLEQADKDMKDIDKTE